MKIVYFTTGICAMTLKGNSLADHSLNTTSSAGPINLHLTITANLLGALNIQLAVNPEVQSGGDAVSPSPCERSSHQEFHDNYLPSIDQKRMQPLSTMDEDGNVYVQTPNQKINWRSLKYEKDVRIFLSGCRSLWLAGAG